MDYTPHDVRIIPISEFVRTNVSGTVDLQTKRALLKKLLTSSNHHILIDCRASSSQSTTVDVWMLAAELGKLGMTNNHRIAILHNTRDGFDPASFLELCATNRGYQLRAFHDFEQATMWLASEETAAV